MTGKSTTEITVNRTHFPVEALGPGRRFGVWVQGCGLACPGCLARDTWDRAGGTPVPVADLLAGWLTARAAGASGLTISGGEPLDQPDGLAAFLSSVRAAPVGNLVDVLVYTGYELATARELAPETLALADAVITGRFDVTRPTDLIWRGSANQRLVPLSQRGRERFGPFVDATVDHPPAQVTVTGDRIWFIGVPRVGDLPAIDRRLRDAGYSTGKVTWRP